MYWFWFVFVHQLGISISCLILLLLFISLLLVCLLPSFLSTFHQILKLLHHFLSPRTILLEELYALVWIVLNVLCHYSLSFLSVVRLCTKQCYDFITFLVFFLICLLFFVVIRACDCMIVFSRIVYASSESNMALAKITRRKMFLQLSIYGTLKKRNSINHEYGQCGNQNKLNPWKMRNCMPAIIMTELIFDTFSSYDFFLFIFFFTFMIFLHLLLHHHLQRVLLLLLVLLVAYFPANSKPTSCIWGAYTTSLICSW